jgi:uncharacterized protein YjbJ (UPF0337 family)
MKTSDQDKLKGAIHQAKGKVKETVGKATDNPTLRVKGAVENAAGHVQEKVGQAEKTLEDASKDDSK